jgi:response regulator NasT
MARKENMPEPLRVLIAEDDTVIAMDLREALESLGHQVIGEASTGVEALRLARELKPDLLLLDIKMPELDGIEVAARILAEYPLAVIMLTAYTDEVLIQRAEKAGALAYLVKPIQEEALKPAIRVAMARFKELQTLRAEVSNLKEALEARKLIERAKGILMEKLGISEAEAMKRLQTQSRNHRKKLVEVAKAILMAQDLLA